MPKSIALVVRTCSMLHGNNARYAAARHKNAPNNEETLAGGPGGGFIAEKVSNSKRGGPTVHFR